jgi:multiple sugar transport system ATP-binding protein
MNLLPAEFAGSTAKLADFGELRLTQAGANGPITVGVRPEQFGIGTPGDLTARGEIAQKALEPAPASG